MENSIDDEAQAFLQRVKTQKNELRSENERLQARVTELEQQLNAARTHLPSCTCQCSGARAVGAAMDTDQEKENPHAASAASSASIPGVSQPIMDILFGESDSRKSKQSQQRLRAPTSAPRSPSSSSTVAATSAHHLSPPRARAKRNGNSAHSSPFSSPSSAAASMSDADKVLAQLDGSRNEQHEPTPATNAATAATAATTTTAATAAAQRKRKSGEARLDGVDENAAPGESAVSDEEETRAKTNKFIRVTSPTGTSGASKRVPAGPGATSQDAAAAAAAEAAPPAELERKVSELVQPSQEAFDQEIFEQPPGAAAAAAAAAANEDGAAGGGGGGGDDSSPEYDYGSHRIGGAASQSEADATRAMWSARILPLDSALLERASYECNQSKIAGNDAFTSGGARIREALAHYSQAIRVLEAGLERCGHRTEAELKPWIDLAVIEATAGTTVAIQEQLDLIRELTAELHPESGPQVNLYALMKQILRQLSSVYANRATCYARTKPPELLKGISDVNYVIQLQPFWFKGYGIKASILVQQKSYSEAILFFEHGLAAPGISREEAAKIVERMKPVQQLVAKNQLKAARAAAAAAGGGEGKMSDGGESAGSSHPGGSLGSTSVGVMGSHHGGVGSSRAPARSHSAAAGSSSSSAAISSHAVGAAMGSVAQPIDVHSSGSFPLSHHSRRDTPLSEIPVHPPSQHTPASPLLPRQQSEDQQMYNLRQDSAEFIMQRQDSEEGRLRLQKQKDDEAALQRQLQQQRKAREEAAAAAIKKEKELQTRPRSPEGGLHVPFSDTSNRLSPTPLRAAAATSNLAPPHSPTRGLPSTPRRSPVHDLTQSPTKRPPSSGQKQTAAAAAAAAAGRGGASPSKSPIRSPARDRPQSSPAHAHSHAPENWFDFPLITAEGVRDLVGDETFAESLALVAERRIDAIKVVRSTLPAGVTTAAAATPTAAAEAPKLLGLAFKSHVILPSGRNRARLAMPHAGESKENNTYTVQLRFDAEQRCKEFSCECRDEREQREEERDRSAAAAAASSAHTPPPPHPHKVWTACKHIGAVLLVLKRKQEEAEKLKPLEWSPADRARRSMFVTPSRRKTLVEQKKEAALRAELEL